MPRRLALIATSLALVVALAGCGSDDDSADDKDTTTTEEEASTTTEADDPGTEESTAPDETTTEPSETPETTEAPDEPETPASTIPIPEGADFCTAYGTFEESVESLPQETIEDIQAAAETLAQAIADLAPLAPAELADAMALLIQATEDLVDATAAATTVDEARGALNEVFSNQEFSGAAQGVDDWFGANCEQADDDQADAESPETVTPG